MLVTPAILWTLLFFVAPFIAMALLSLNFQAEGGMTLSNYSQFFTNPSYYRAMLNSLEVTGLVTLISVLLAYPFAWILAEQIPPRLQRLALLLGYPAVLDLLCGALLFLAPGAGAERCGQ